MYWSNNLDEYRQFIEKDGALERRFQKVMVEPPSLDETYEIIKGLQSRYEAHHKVKFTAEAVDAIVKLSDRYITDRYQPDKSIDVLDETGARAFIWRILMFQRISQISKNRLRKYELKKIRLSDHKTLKKQQFSRPGEIITQ